MNYGLMKRDPFLRRTFGDSLAVLSAIFNRLEVIDPMDPPGTMFDLAGCPPDDDMVRKALDCERALQDVFDLPLWRTGPKAMRARDRGRFKLSRAMAAFAAGGNVLRPGPLPASRRSGLTFVPGLGKEINAIVDAARRGETRHFLFRVADGEREFGRVWSDIFGLAEEISRRTDPASVHCMRMMIADDDYDERPGFVALASAMICDPHAIRVMPGVDLLLGGTRDLSGWKSEGSHKLPPTEAGLDTVEAIVRSDRLLRQLTGVHVWCCPASTKAEDAPWVLATGRAVLPGFERIAGRRAVYDRVYMPQSSLYEEHQRWTNDQHDEYWRDLKRLSDVVFDGQN